VSLLTEHRREVPYGLVGGLPGAPGRQVLFRNGTEEQLPGTVRIEVLPGDMLSMETPGGGGWGRPGGVG